MTIAHFRLAYTGMHDSQLCIEFLTGKFQNDISSSLEQSTARAYQIMGEDHLFWQVLVSSQTHLINHFIYCTLCFYKGVGFMASRVQ